MYSMNIDSKIRVITIFGTLFLMGFACSCASNSRIVYEVVSLRGNIFINGTKGYPQEQCLSGDSIITESVSYAVIRLNQNSSLLLFPESELKINVNGIELVNGVVYYFSPASQTEKYQIVCSDNKIEMNKCSAMISLVQKYCCVEMVRGESAVTTGSRNPVQLEPHYEMLVSANGAMVPTPIDSKRENQLLNIDSIQFPVNGRSLVISAETEKEILNYSIGYLAARASVLDLRIKLGALSKVTTNTGKEYEGAVKISGHTAFITTVSGEVKVPVKDIKTVTRFEP